MMAVKTKSPRPSRDRPVIVSPYLETWTKQQQRLTATKRLRAIVLGAVTGIVLVTAAVIVALVMR